MQKVAITGNIASGKSTVENILKEMKYPVLDTDIVCHDLLNNLEEIKTIFNKYDILDGDIISREKLGKLVFNNLELRKKLEDILYPHVKTKINEFFEQHKQEKYSFVEIPMLFEAGMENLFDKIMFIYCEDEIRMKRLIQRNGYSEEYAKKRMISQLPQNEKLEKSDWIINNNLSIEELKKEISKLIV